MRLLPILLGIAAIPFLCAAPRADGHFDRTLSVSGPVELEATTGAGGIQVTRGSGGTVRIHAILESSDDWFGVGDAEAHIREIERNPPVERNGNRVRVGYGSDRHLLEGVSMRLEIEVPADTKVHAHASSGGVEVSGIRGPVDCRTGSGGIHLRDIEGDASAEASSGGIRMLRVMGSASAHVSSGGIEAYDIGGPIDAHTSSGGIRLSQTHAAPIRAQASSGGVRVSLAQGQGYDLNVRSASGHISLPDMAARATFSRHSAEGRVRGGGPEVEIRASSGNVRVD